MQQTTTSPITALATAEAALIATVEQATARVNRIAADALDAALNNLDRACDNARSRLAAALGRFREVTGELTREIEALAISVAADVDASQNVEVSAPPMSAPVVSPSAEIPDPTYEEIMAEIDADRQAEAEDIKAGRTPEPVDSWDAAPVTPISRIATVESRDDRKSADDAPAPENVRKKKPGGGGKSRGRAGSNGRA